ncbi:MAG TPA: DUF262 domain-containing protein [Stellaceae bacterium]|nr:DUF262 domain-containing protein [Stellaceae bacterium]
MGGQGADEVVPANQPSEIEDEYTLALEAEVEDEALLEQPGDIKFTITSYGADYTVDTLVKRLKSEAFYVPQFQRRFVWSQRHASRFLESLLMGLPVPGIFLYKEPVTNRHLVVDGQQRLRTLQYFYAGVFLEKKFRLTGVRDEWNNKSYEELSGADRLKLDDATVHATIFQQDEPKHSRKSLHFVFERINSGGIRLSPQEIRNCISDGPLLIAIREVNEDETWRNVFGKHRNARLKDQELILRFLAMHERGDKYASPMREFLNEFADDYNKASKEKLDQLKGLFTRTIKACWDAKQREAFRPVRSLNAAVFEGVMLGVAARLLQAGPPATPQGIAKAYDHLLADKVFLRACDRATAVEESVRIRRTHAVKAFSQSG